MPPSQRVPIPPGLAEAKSLREMCAAADQLKGYDTPQALPVLGILDKRAPSRASMVVNLLLGTLVDLVFFLFLLAGVGIVAWVTFIAYQRLLYPIYLDQERWLLVWGVVALLTILWLIVFNDKARVILHCDTGPALVKLSQIWRGLLWLARQITRIAMVATWLVGIATLLLPVFFGLAQARDLLQSLDPIQLGPVPPLEQVLGLDPFIRIGPMAILVVAGIVAVVMFKWAWSRSLLLGAFWAFGLWRIYESVGLGQVELGVVVGLAVLWPLQIPYIFARLLGRSYRRWRGQIEKTVLGWELRDSLSAAFAAHRARNRKQVANSGATAVCKSDLAFFVQRRAGPVSYWCCPECLDDDSAYLGVKLVRGVLDNALKPDYAQEGSTLQVNLRAWQDSRGVRLSPPLQEVTIGKLADPHEVEMFITQYHSVQAERNWPSLGKVAALITSDSNLDENGRRQVQRHLRIM